MPTIPRDLAKSCKLRCIVRQCPQRKLTTSFGKPTARNGTEVTQIFAREEFHENTFSVVVAGCHCAGSQPGVLWRTAQCTNGTHGSANRAAGRSTRPGN